MIEFGGFAGPFVNTPSSYFVDIISPYFQFLLLPSSCKSKYFAKKNYIPRPLLI